ncbi:hypothetical protein HZS55_08355 [Halosimplex rubrum]|uniref:DUF4352 domain-containing protein n=1 Tax=Halosimplex rubrum TaxID=869889 RepID=A0A7D5NZH5_9EURY|nr:hypothetical protein [Halosimplex rubrum]QLH77303.1 hypothetical protein HZS55_08355 [Halosimplex rubrum]
MNGRAVLAWVTGVLLTLLGLVFLVGAPPVGVVVLLVGLYVLPPVNRRVEIDISPSWAVSWTAGVLLFLFALVIVHLVPLAGAVAAVGGLFALPPVRRQVTSRTGRELGRGAVVGVVLLAAVGAGGTAALALETDETLGTDTKVHDVGERFVVDEDDTDLAVTVQGVNRTYSLDRPEAVVVGSPEEVYLVVTVRIENVGDEHVPLRESTLLAVSADDERSYQMHEGTDDIREGGPYRAPGLELSPTTSGPRLDGGEEITRTIAFRVDRDRTYLLTNQATGPYSGADRHYVPLGDV